MKYDNYGIVGLEILYQTVIGFVGKVFRGKRPEHSVPDNQRARIIRIQITRILAMMDAVVRRRVKNSFNPGV